MGMIHDNLAALEERVLWAAQRAGRAASGVRIMVVTKTQSRERVEAAYEAGARLFGENRIGEAGEKFAGFHADAELHMIGHLQRNKANRAAELVRCVQSIDKIETASALQKHAAALGRSMEILLEVNTSGEESKEGFRSDDELFRAVEAILPMANLVPLGLMTVAPFTDEEGRLRSCFRKLASLREELRRRFPSEPWNELSMGMSNDFEFAIEEGSTLVRVGSAVFGPRERQ